MNHQRSFTVLIALIATLAAGLVLGCGPQRVQTQVRPGQDLIVLLPDPGDGTIGRAVVSSPTGTAELTSARASILVSPNRGPVPVTVMKESDVRRLFG